MIRMARKIWIVYILAFPLWSGAGGFVHADASVTIQWDNTQQEMDGFGASSAWMSGAISGYPAKEREEILDALFSPISGAGLSILRNRIPSEIERKPGLWDWDTDKDALWLMTEAKKRGVDKIWSTPWTPPAWMKTNNSLENGGSLLPEHYQDYADYLAQYLLQYKAKHGVDLYGISLQNEPSSKTSYESCVWTGEEFHQFIRNYLLPTFQNNGVTAKVIMPEAEKWSEDLAKETLDDPITAAAVEVVAAHRYGGVIKPFTNALSKGKKVWQTEASELKENDSSIVDGLRWAREIHNALVLGQASAWHYWWLFADRDNGQSLIQGNKGHTTYKINKRLWTMGNYSRFVRPGYTMIGMSSNIPEPGVNTSSFVDPKTGKYVIVAINSKKEPTVLNVSLGNKKSLLVMPYRTSATEDLLALVPIAVSKETFVSNLPAQSVTTFIGEPKPAMLSGLGMWKYVLLLLLTIVGLSSMLLAWKKLYLSKRNPKKVY